MKRDAVPAMEAAMSMYLSLGLRDAEPYTVNPVPGLGF
jgi:hypothetical protein